MRRFALLGIVCLCAEVALAVDPPHWTSPKDTIDCETSCHDLHTALGGTLTQSAANANLCQSCHNAAGLAAAMPINNADKALPGTRGTSHNFDATQNNATYGAQAPSNTEMQKRVYGGKIVCSTCHDQHAGVSGLNGTAHISAATKFVDYLGTGTVTSAGAFTGAAGLWYRIRIDGQGSQATATFRWSTNNGTSWVATGVGAGNGSPVPLASGVSVVFTGAGAGAFVLNEEWMLYGSYPFLRAALDSGDNTTGTKFCRDCHDPFTMDVTDVETYGGAKPQKSHPVGLALGTGGRTYDRATPLDGNGAVQGSPGADNNATNVIRIDAGNRIQCLSCHGGMHFVDSNTLTQDGP